MEALNFYASNSKNSEIRQFGESMTNVTIGILVIILAIILFSRK